MQTPSTLAIWLSQQLIPLAIIASLLALVVCILSWSAHTRQKRMKAARAGASEETFVDSLVLFGFDAKICRTAYQYLQQSQQVCFPIQAGDLLDEDLGLDNADVEQSVRELMSTNSRLYQPCLQHRPIVTVEDLVRLSRPRPGCLN